MSIVLDYFTNIQLRVKYSGNRTKIIIKKLIFKMNYLLNN